MFPVPWAWPGTCVRLRTWGTENRAHFAAFALRTRRSPPPLPPPRCEMSLRSVRGARQRGQHCRCRLRPRYVRLLPFHPTSIHPSIPPLSPFFWQHPSSSSSSSVSKGVWHALCMRRGTRGREGRSEKEELFLFLLRSSKFEMGGVRIVPVSDSIFNMLALCAFFFC